MQTKLGDGSVMISGIVGKDAETKRVGEKNSVLTKFSVKVGERKIQGEEKAQAIWANCTAWNDMGKAASTLKKGDSVFVVGRLRNFSYTGKDGEEKSGSEIVCEFLTGVYRSMLPEIGSADAPPPDSGGYEYNPNDNDLPF